MGTKDGGKIVTWDGDIVDGKSSWDVLLEWLADGNYDRWVDDAAGPKKGLCRELSDLLKTRGYRERSAPTTFYKIWTLERSVAHAKHMLEAAGQGGLESLQSCDDELTKKVLRHCPYFAQLAPIMKSLKSCPLETFSSKKHKEQNPAGRRRKRTKRLAQRSAAQSAGVSDDSPSYDDEDESPSELDDEELEDEQVNEPEHENDTETGETELGQSASSIDPLLGAASYDLSLLQQQELEDRCMRFEQYHERNRIELESERDKRALELEVMRKKHDSELEALRQRLEIDVETARAKSKIDVETAECDLQLTRDVNATSLATERALSRQKLVKAGISQQEVDRLLPSKPCSS